MDKHTDESYDWIAWYEELAKHPSSDHPKLLIVVGPPRVGKSTLIEWLREYYKHAATALAGMGMRDYLTSNPLIINPELVKAIDSKLSKGEYKPFEETHLQGHDEKDPKNRGRYYQTRYTLVMDALKAGKSVILDDHCEDILPPSDDLSVPSFSETGLGAPPDIKQLIEDIKTECPNVKTGAIGIILNAKEYKKRLTKKLKEMAPDFQSQDYEFAINIAKQFFGVIDHLSRIVDHTIVIENNGQKLTDHPSQQPNILVKFETDGLGARGMPYRIKEEDYEGFKKSIAALDQKPDLTSGYDGYTKHIRPLDIHFTTDRHTKEHKSKKPWHKG